MCEDWYHGRHLIKGDQKLPKDENYAEMICYTCVEKHQSILGSYMSLSVDTKAEENVDIEKSDPEKKCKKPEIEKTEAKTMFLIANWRQELCKCDDCLKLYQENNVKFLIDEEDTVHHYESQAKNEGSQYEKGMEALSSMDRVKQVEAIQGYNAMKANLMEYLKKFAENGKVVRQEDIQEFFEKMQSKKKARVEIPKFCR